LVPVNASHYEDESNQEGSKNDPNTPIIKCVVGVLQRTKHLISSIHYPTQIIVLDILDISLKIVRNYENEFLPMVHQNWHGLVQKFDDRWTKLTESQKFVLIKALEVVVTLCEFSKMFLYHKIINDFVPKLIPLVRIAKTPLDPKRPLLADEKLHIALKKCLPLIITNCELPPEIGEKFSIFISL